MTTILQDLQFALRQLRRAPGFALTAILTLALGIGANTAIFSLLDQALLRALPVRDPASLILLSNTGQMWEGHSSSHGGDSGAYFSYPMYRNLRDQATAFSGLIATAPAGMGFNRGGQTQVVDSEIVTGNYFSVLGVKPALGRLFTPADDAEPLANPVAVLSYDFWRNNLAADPAVLGSSISLNGHPYSVVGVASPSFHSAIMGEAPSLFVPFAMLDQALPGKGKRLTDHTDKWINILGRLSPGTTRAQAQASIGPLWHALRAEELKSLGTMSPSFVADFLTNARLLVLPGARGFSYNLDHIETVMLAVMAMAALVLVIASVNVASLLLVRSAGRVREFSLRSALGATRSRLISQLLIEGVLIGLGGGIIGLAFAPAVLRVLVHRMADPDSGASALTTTLDHRVLAFNFVVAIAVSLCFSLAPALQLRRPDLTTTLRESTGTGAGSMLTLRRVVVCLQIGLSVVLLMGSGLFVRTLQKLHAVNPGFNTSHLITFTARTRLSGYAADQAPGINRRILDDLANTAGIQSVGGTDLPELANSDASGNVLVAGYNAPRDEQYDVQDPIITPNYFSVLQVPLLAGRIFTEQDTATTPHVAMVNETFARHFCGSPQSCLGRQMQAGGNHSKPLDLQIVGIVRDYKHTGLREDASPMMFRPLRQIPETTSVTFYVRTLAEPAASLAIVRARLHALDPNLVLSTVMTMGQRIDRELTDDALITLLAVGFGALATLLAGVGLYGVLAYSTAQRTREIGIRMALGSTRLAVSSLIVSDVVRLAAIGLALALPAAYGLSLLLRSQLFGVTALDPVVLLSVTLLIALVALAAALVPARRAASINPTEALRSE